MDDKSRPDSLQATINRGPHWIEEWLRRVDSGAEVWPDGSFLLGLGEGAAFRARDESSLEWATIAVHAFELLAHREPSVKDSALDKAMLLRAWFITRLGASSTSPVLNVEIVFQWFETALKYSLPEVRQKITRWREVAIPVKERLSTDELGELRAIKNRLGTIKVLADAGIVPAGSPIYQWLELREKLP